MEVADNSVINVLGRVLDLSSRRASLAAANVANIDTPGYKAEKMDFQSELEALAPQPDMMEPVRTDSKHIAPVEEAFSRSRSNERATEERYDGNTVNIEQELSELLEAEIYFSAASRLISKKIGMINQAITG